MPEHLPGSGPVAYLTSAYPKVSHTFIQREIAGVRAHGIDILPCAVRAPDSGDLTGPEEAAARDETFYILARARNPLRLIADHVRVLISGPGQYTRALWLALSTAPPGFRAGLWQIFYFAEAAVLSRYMQRQGVVHLHAHFANSGCSVAMLAHVMTGIPFSFTMHGPSEFFAAAHWRLDEKVARARFVSCISHFCRSQLMIFADRSHWSKLQVVHCALDPAVYDRPRPVPGKQLLFVGRLAAEKGVPVLLEALATVRDRHPEVHLTLVGDGPDRTGLEALAQAQGLAGITRFAGACSQDEVAAHLTKADVFVLPSFAEGLPVVLMEALASRVPVVATRIAGIAELVVDNETGILVPPGDAAALASALDRLLKMPGTGIAMGRAGRDKVIAEFNIRHETARLAALLTGSRGPAS